jgi:hypothetical protein
MKNFIKATDADTDEECYLNIQHITAIIPKESYTLIQFSSAKYSVVKNQLTKSKS